MKKNKIRTFSLLLVFSLMLCSLATAYADENTSFVEDVTNILIVGQDNDNLGGIEKNGNADGEIILSVNNKTGKIFLTSIARDTVLSTDTVGGGTKATLIYHYDGIEALENAIELSLGIHIDHHLIFNYLSVIDIIDSLGGVDLELYDTEISTTNGKIQQMNQYLLELPANDGLIEQKAGMMHLTGKQAAGFMRIRISDQSGNDFGRTERNRNVLLALKDAFFNKTPEELKSTLLIALPNVKTDFTIKELLALTESTTGFADYIFVSQCIPIEGSYYGSEGYTHIDFDVNSAFLQSTVYGE